MVASDRRPGCFGAVVNKKNAYFATEEELLKIRE
jgi:hypothetical protein